MDFNFWQTIIVDYGHFLVFLGTFLEGEVIVIVAGYLAKQGLLNIYLVILMSIMGTILCDQLIFLLGHFYGERILKRFPKEKIEKAKKMVRKYDSLYILAFRFIYGLRIISPIILGASKVSILKFAVLNIVSSILWATVFAFGGYFIGQVFGQVAGQIEIGLGLFFIAAIATVYIIKKRTARIKF